jgi:hypothetical protein
MGKEGVNDEHKTQNSCFRGRQVNKLAEMIFTDRLPKKSQFDFSGKSIDDNFNVKMTNLYNRPWSLVDKKHYVISKSKSSSSTYFSWGHL